MNSILRLTLLLTASAAVLVPSAIAQRQLGKKKGPTSKLYLAETVGQGEITNEGRTYSPKQATAFDAPGTVIETRGESHQAFVYSNGTGMFVDADTRIEVDRFVQEPFRPDRNKDTNVEPSISQSDVFLARGQIGVCTSQMVSGSTMQYSTPHGGVNIRGGKVAIQSQGDTTTVFLLEGDVTVRGGTRSGATELLRPGEKATITAGPPGQPPRITVGPIDQQTMAQLDEKVSIACNAKKTVTFEAIEVKAEQGLEASEQEPPAGENPTPASNPAPAAENTGELGSAAASTGTEGETTQEIVVVPSTPASPPTNIVVSPARIGPGE